MILTWMLGSTVFALLLASTAWLSERALMSVGKPRRGPWIVAIAVSTLWPLVAGVWFLASPKLPAVAMITTRIGTNAATALTTKLAVGPSLELMANRGLVAGWLLVSLALAIRIVVGVQRMRTVIRAANQARLNGTDVLLTDATGPALCGVRHPQIVVPRWIMDLDAPLQLMVLRHEQEHRDRGDSGLILGCAVAVALVPWNPVVWLMVRRLRLAIELDCDGRVLASNTDPNRYGRLLMLVAQRQVRAHLVPMLAESNAHLERRIGAMNAPLQRRSRMRAAAFGFTAAATAVLAGSTPVMAGVTNPASRNAALVLTARRSGVTSRTSRNYVLELPAAMAVPEHIVTLDTPAAQSAPAKQAQGKPVPPTPPAKVDSVTKVAPPPQRKEPTKEYFEFVVEKPAQPDQGNQMAEEASRTQRPGYPDLLRAAGVEGDVVAQLVVNADGTPMEGSLKILKSTHALFTEAVRAAFPNMRYTPATVGGRAVRQLIQQSFEFRTSDSGTPGYVERIGDDTVKGPIVHKTKSVVITVPNVKKP